MFGAATPSRAARRSIVGDARQPVEQAAGEPEPTAVVAGVDWTGNLDHGVTKPARAQSEYREGEAMTLFKTLGLTAVIAFAVAITSTGSAMAESTALCDQDPGTGASAVCPPGHLLSHLHERGILWIFHTSVTDVFCTPLHLGDVKSANNLGAPLVIEGNYTFSSCTSSIGGCSVTEVNGPSSLKVLKMGHETASVTYAFEVHIVCSVWLNCTYNGVGLKATAKGPLLATEENGEIYTAEQSLNKVAGGFLCPNVATLEVVETPLSAFYITK
jgi:hypothetical protein